MKDKKKNIPLIIALLIPVLMVVLIAVSIYLPAAFIKPKVDFIYSVGEDYYCYRVRYSVKDSQIVQNEIENRDDKTCSQNYEVKLFYYDVEEDRSKAMTFDEAQKLTLDGSLRSADGFEIASGGDSFDLLFIGGSSYYSKYLKKGAFSRRLKIEGSGAYYHFRFIGWVTGGNHG